MEMSPVSARLLAGMLEQRTGQQRRLGHLRPMTRIQVDQVQPLGTVALPCQRGIAG